MDDIYCVDDAKAHQRMPTYRVPQANTSGLFGEEGMTFDDFIDIINPLQHIPLVNILYRELTGDTIKPGPRMIGGGLFFGGLGVLSSAVNAAVEETTGKDIGGTLLAMVSGEELTPPVRTPQGQQYATATPPAATATDTETAALPAAPVAAALPPAASGSFGGIARMPGSASTAGLMPPGSIPGQAAMTRDAMPANTMHANSSAAAGVTGGAIPAGATGLTTKSGLPSAGSMTPAAASLVLAQMAPDAAQTTQSPMLAAATQAAGETVAPAARAAEADAAPARTLPRGRGNTDGMPAPQRTNNATPRQPIVLTHPGVGRDSGNQPSRGHVAARTDDQPAILTPAAVTATAGVTPVAAVSTTTAGAPGVVPGNPSDAMLRALDKYDALLKARRGAGGEVDRSL